MKEAIERVLQKEIGRRGLLKLGRNIAMVGGCLAVAKVALPEIARAEEEWMPRYDFWRINLPDPITGKSDERVPFYLSTVEGNTAVITCGPFSWTDNFGIRVDLQGGVDRASFAIIKGPIGPENGGALVAPLVVPGQNWVGVTPNPEGGLKDIHWLTIARERESSLRSPDLGNFKGSQIDMVVIDGRKGAIEYIGTMFPRR